MFCLVTVDIDECLSSPCQNNGTCSDEVNGYSCACIAGYTGADCETSKLLFDMMLPASRCCDFVHF